MKVKKYIIQKGRKNYHNLTKKHKWNSLFLQFLLDKRFFTAIVNSLIVYFANNIIYSINIDNDKKNRLNVALFPTNIIKKLFLF